MKDNNGSKQNYEGQYGKIQILKVREWICKANQTIAKIQVQFERHGGTEHQMDLLMTIKETLMSNKYQSSSDFNQLAELKDSHELEELLSTDQTIEQDKWINHLKDDFYILGNYALGMTPTTLEPTRNQMLNISYWSCNIDLFENENN